MQQSFWIDGPLACEQGLRKHYEPLLNELRRRLAESADVEEQSKIVEQLDTTKAEYR